MPRNSFTVVDVNDDAPLPSDSDHGKRASRVERPTRNSEPSLFAQQQIHDPTPADTQTFTPAVGEDVFAVLALESEPIDPRM
jgi:hypothetical protein